jgi:hypothetical protein
MSFPLLQRKVQAFVESKEYQNLTPSDITKRFQELILEASNKKSYRLDIGKYRRKSLEEIYNKNPDYIWYLINNVRLYNGFTEEVKNELQSYDISTIKEKKTQEKLAKDKIAREKRQQKRAKEKAERAKNGIVATGTKKHARIVKKETVPKDIKFTTPEMSGHIKTTEDEKSGDKKCPDK